MLTNMKAADTMPGSAAGLGAQGRSAQSFEAAMKELRSLQTAMREPETAQAVLKGMGMVPDIFMKFAETTWDACFEMQKKSIQRAGTIGQRVDAYQFESVDQDFFKALKDIYEQELQRFFHTPQMGLTRFYRERQNRFLDRMNLMNLVAMESLSLLMLPFERSFKVLQQQMDDLAREGKLTGETREYYAMFIRVLEGHFMTFLKSPEYNRTLGALFDTLSEHIIARNEVLQDCLQALPVTTCREMDELYKELYLLKKRVKLLEMQLEKNIDNQIILRASPD